MNFSSTCLTKRLSILNGSAHIKEVAPLRLQKNAIPAAEEGGEDEGPEESEEMKIYCHAYKLEPLIKDQHDLTSYGALRKKLRALDRLRIFDRKDAPPLTIKRLALPGQSSVIDMSDSREQAVVNIVIARSACPALPITKWSSTEEQNVQRKIFLTIEEAHGFVSREKQEQMEQTLDELRLVIARRGRKRWLCSALCHASHPSISRQELFELAKQIRSFHLNKLALRTFVSSRLAAGTVNGRDMG